MKKCSVAVRSCFGKSREFPYADLVQANRSRGKHESEYELLDTGVFDGDRYFDVFVEYGRINPSDVNMLITVHNRGPESAIIHILPQLWFRNTWSWRSGALRPNISARNSQSVNVAHPDPDMGEFQFFVERADEWLITENETNGRRLYNLKVEGHFKDAFHEYVVKANSAAVNSAHVGTKTAAHIIRNVPAGSSVEARACLRAVSEGNPFEEFDDVMRTRRAETDAYYTELQKDISDPDARLVQRQALAGMIWSKQYFYYDVAAWLHGDPQQPPPPSQRLRGRNFEWKHLDNDDVISMPDKWEYPWYAAWDLAFQTVAIALVDVEFAKSQLLLMTREWYMHPNGQLPAYEWAFGDVNPPVHAWATWRVFQMDRERQRGRGDAEKGDVGFLERIFHKLMLNFTWWVNRKDRQGRNIFQGGFLGLDNIGVFDRSAPLPSGGFINQADGTSWMAMYSLNLLRIALELAQYNDVYEDIATKFFEHFLHIAEAMNDIGEVGLGLWDEEDEFYYDVLKPS